MKVKYKLIIPPVVLLWTVFLFWVSGVDIERGPRFASILGLATVVFVLGFMVGTFIDVVRREGE